MLSAAGAVVAPVAQGPETHSHKLLKLEPQAAGNHG